MPPCACDGFLIVVAVVIDAHLDGRDPGNGPPTKTCMPRRKIRNGDIGSSRAARGDGAVPAWSAANTVGNSLPGSLPSFSEHATIFDDKGVDLISSAPGFCDGRDLPAYDDRRG